MCRAARRGRRRSWMVSCGYRIWWARKVCAGGIASITNHFYRAMEYNNPSASGIGNETPAEQAGKARWTASADGGTGALNNATIKEKLVAKFGDQLTAWEEPYNLLTFG